MPEISPTQVQLQPKLTVNTPGDKHEQEADRVADQVMRMPEPKVQRQCACGKSSGEEECSECKQKKLESKRSLQRTATSPVGGITAPPIVDSVLSSAGSPLPDSTLEFMESRFGQDFSHVKVHTDERAIESAAAVQARAYTVGDNIVFGRGENPSRDQHLLAHELTHVVQQSNHAEYASLSRKETLGTKVTALKGEKKHFRVVTASFDGQDFVVIADGTEILRVPGESGRPLHVSPADAKRYGGSTDDFYMNNPLYEAAKENGPIPTGQYSFRFPNMTTFTPIEQAKIMTAHEGDYVDSSGKSLHGDWGAGRVELTPAKGNKIAGRSGGFYLHGGILAGSSGCINIGNSAIEQLKDLLLGFNGTVNVQVQYTQSPEEVGLLDQAGGRFKYPGKDNPSVWDRLKATVFGRPHE